MTGYTEESPGVRSMSRLSILLLTICAMVIVAATSVYVLRSPDPSAAVIAAMGGLLTPIVVQGAVAIIKRGQGDEETK